MKCVRRPHARYTTCQCPSCRTLMAKVNKYKRSGLLTRVPSSVAWERVDEWMAAGFEARWMESASGIPVRSLQTALHERRRGHPPRNFGPRYAQMIMDTDIWSGTEGRGPALGTRRRLQALAWMGWTVEALGEETGISFVTLATVQRGAGEKVAARIYRAVAEAYERLSETDGGSHLAFVRASKLGYLPPAAWDNPDTDADAAPEVDVDDVVVARIIAGERLRCTKAERFEVIRQWRAAGRSLNELIRVTGWQVYREINEMESAA